MSAETLNLTPELYTYLQKNSLREPEVLKNLRRETRKKSNHVMQISPEQGQFMAMLVDLLGAKKTVDIGTFTGYSALAVALALPADGKVITCDISAEAPSIGKTFWSMAGVSEKIDLQIGEATKTLKKLINEGQAGTFDFSFIDADKLNYPTYYELSLSLLRRGGLIAIDNVLWGGAVADLDNQEADTKSIRSLNEFILKDERVTISMLPIGDGLTLARKR